MIVLKYTAAEQKIKKILMRRTTSSVLQDVVDFLYNEFEVYSWVGIYLVQDDMLVLGPWQGTSATEHTKIPIGKGVCGAAAKSGTTEIVDDVSQDSRYLSCFLSTRSEIVVPIIKNNSVIGEIDIDSDKPAAFTHDDKLFLEKIADMLAEHI
jgi:L-methionine (R)-S-oxide reductase